MKTPTKKKVTRKPRQRIEKSELVTQIKVAKSTLPIDEQFEKHRGEFARVDGHVGIVCGYNEKKLIMAVTRGCGKMMEDGKGNIIVTYQKNKNGYLYVSESEII